MWPLPGKSALRVVSPDSAGARRKPAYNENPDIAPTLDLMHTTSPRDSRIISMERLASGLQRAGHSILRYGLVFILGMIGFQKWTMEEAKAIQPWMAHSPLLSWPYSATTIQGASIAVGVCELVMAALIAVRRWAPMLAAAGSA